MKKILLLLFLCTGMVKAQNVDIPDANLKAALLSSDVTNAIATDNFEVPIKIDANSDGEIQETEAQAVNRLNIGNNGPIPSGFNISDMTGIASFINLSQLNCSGNQIASLDVSALTLLEKLDASQNQISTVNVGGLTNLKFLYLQENQIPTIDLTGLIRLADLNLSRNLLTTITLTGLTDLQILNLGFNQFTAIDFSNATNIEQVYVYNNQLTALNFTGFNNLVTLDCSQNLIPSIDFSNLSGLQFLYCGNNLLTTLNVSNLVNLITLTCNNNNLTVLDISTLSNLQSFNCSFNNLTSVDLSATTLIQSLDCSFNQLTNLDVSAQTGLSTLHIENNQISDINLSNNGFLFQFFGQNNLMTTLNVNSNNLLVFMDVSGNSNLQTVFMNNGVFTPPSLPAFFNFNNCPNLSYICVQEEGISYVEGQVALNSGASNVVVNSYCSFSPSGNYNTIAGTIKFDMNGDGCDAADEVLPNLRVNLSDGINQGASFINAAGNYQFFTQTGNFSITPSIENPAWFNFTPATADVNFADNNNNTATQDFCLTANGIHPDVAIVIAPIFYARPGFNATYQVVFTNNGNQTLSGLVRLNFNDNLMNFVSASVNPDITEVGGLAWNYINLQPFESRSFDVVFAINATSDIPAVNIGDQLTFTAGITPIDIDENPANNEFQLTETVVDAEILNDIYCLEGNVVDPSYIGDYLHYMINFENVGTLSAQNIVIRFDVDPSNFDINSLQLLNASNPVYTRIVGNVVEFIFQNINLEIGGHGSILLKLRTNDTLVPSDMVSNRANIFFDFNAPVNTGLANTTFQALSTLGFEKNQLVAIYPNPTNSIINIKSDVAIQSVQLLDIQGRILNIQNVDDKQLTVDLSAKAKGIYFLKVATDKGMMIKKVIKE